VTIPARDRYGNELLPGSEVRRLDKMDQDQFDALPDDVKKRYFASKEDQLRKRLGGGEGGSLRTEDGMTIDEAIAYLARIKEHREKVHRQNPTP
jgi:hypothetical protein